METVAWYMAAVENEATSASRLGPVPVGVRRVVHTRLDPISLYF
jgi:hypothetical protein